MCNRYQHVYSHKIATVMSIYELKLVNGLHFLEMGLKVLITGEGHNCRNILVPPALRLFENAILLKTLLCQVRKKEWLLSKVSPI